MLTPDVRDVLVRHDAGRWWIDNGFGVNVLARDFDSPADAARLARIAVSPWGGRVLVEREDGWELAEGPGAAVGIGTSRHARVA